MERRKFNVPIRTDVEKPGRNQPCPCGSGRKYKKCCMGLNAFQEEVAYQKAHLMRVMPEAKVSMEERKRIMSPQETVPSNDFRKELEAENVSDNELMLRDQIIMARAMESNHRQSKFMREMLEASAGELLGTRPRHPM